MRTLLDEILNEQSSITTSCEPGRFTDALSVIWWGPRTRIPREIDPAIDLAILSRGRIRLPVQKMDWLIQLAREGNKAEDWVSRLPINLSDLMPKVDVSFELFIEQYFLSDVEKKDTVNRYLARRHKEELNNCFKGFYIFHIIKAEEAQKIEKLTGVNLSKLFTKANVPTPARMGSNDRELYYLVVYISFPNEIENVLTLPPPFNDPKFIANARLKNRLQKALVDPDFGWDTLKFQHLRCLINKLQSDEINDRFLTNDRVNTFDREMGRKGIDANTIGAKEYLIINFHDKTYEEFKMGLLFIDEGIVEGIKRSNFLFFQNGSKWLKSLLCYMFNQSKRKNTIYSCYANLFGKSMTEYSIFEGECD